LGKEVCIQRIDMQRLGTSWLGLRGWKKEVRYRGWDTGPRYFLIGIYSTVSILKGGQYERERFIPEIWSMHTRDLQHDQVNS
jgi:hypothetical protein